MQHKVNRRQTFVFFGTWKDTFILNTNIHRSVVFLGCARPKLYFHFLVSISCVTPCKFQAALFSAAPHKPNFHEETNELELFE